MPHHRALVSSIWVAVLLAMVTTAFDPLSVTSGVLSVWMDGADPLGTGVLPADGALCQWKDKSGLGNHGVAQNAANQDTTNPTYCPDYAGSDRSVTFTTSRTASVKRFYGVRGYSGVPEQEEIFAVFELKKYEGGYIAIVGGDTAHMDASLPSTRSAIATDLGRRGGPTRTIYISSTISPWVAELVPAPVLTLAPQTAASVATLAAASWVKE